ncbi:MAG: C40 family peptidase [Candidatus Pseudobacter hemicellulosilyticus]|uniref:C40 family peptidase n=1 Tax=Candidatus Pseudobacter hemicellulosilyticus TaxID=3121375 RepID=A0AAJ5WX46_9BACT|nr:MAG: C40 family peptidase [Pseudobacter sp.]
MAIAFCTVPVSPLRALASHRSEMVSQLLLGEYGTILEEEKDFLRISCAFDGYEGWVARNQVLVQEQLPPGMAVLPMVSGTDIGPRLLPVNTMGCLLLEKWTTSVFINGLPAWAPMGAPVQSLPAQELKLGNFSIGYPAGGLWDTRSAATSDAIRVISNRLLNTPYLWGGRSIYGIDCSGFTQLVFRFFNKPLLRDAYLQATQGEPIGFLQEARCGDLAFFDNAEGRITHVGILLNEAQIIHASGKVRIDPIDNAGIVNGETGERTHQLRLLKRYF